MRTVNFKLAGLTLLVTTASARFNLTGSGGVYSTNKTCNGTTYGPTSATGTSVGSTKSPQCVFTTSLLTYEATTISSTAGDTLTDLGDGPYISGDTLMPVNGTATAFVTSAQRFLDLSAATDFISGPRLRQQYPRPEPSLIVSLSVDCPHTVTTR